MTALTGTGGMIRLILRRDRFLLPVWILFPALMPLSFIASFEQLYPTAAERLGYARATGETPTFLALYGPLHDTSIGAIVAQRSGFIPVVVGLFCALTVIRHTRTEEEAGRRELLGATVMGRGATLAAALLVSSGAALAIGAVLTAGMASQGLPFGGSLAFGLQLALAGLVFAAVAGVAAQLTEGAGAARGIAIAALGGAFVVRMAADVGGDGSALGWLSWLSPLGWGTRLQAYGDEQWWVLVIPALAVALLIAAAGVLTVRRDVGAGILPPRLGPADAAPGLRGPFSLAWRLHGRGLYGWLAGFAALGVVWGGVAGTVEDMLKDNPDLEEIFSRLGGGTGAIVDVYFASVMGIMGLIAAGYAVSATLRMRSEETALRAEPVLATTVGRIRWAASHLVIAALGSAAAMAVGGFTAGLTRGLDAGDIGREVPRVTLAAVAQLPAVWVIGAVTVAFFGLLPRFGSAGWGALALAAFVTLFGGAVQADQWVLDISPFTHIPKLPGGDAEIMPFAWLVAVVLALGAAGLAGFRRRDLASA
ncbi:ABC transporter permease [Actinomadura sp. 9N407]|uniref:ABC transporter permease n=1 Tax=Actinomadura sp. 9N407 TaxID=3375154 RepID=UPI003792C34B